MTYDPESFSSALAQLLGALTSHEDRAVQDAVAACGPALPEAIRQGPERFHEDVLWPWNELIETSVSVAYPDLDRASCNHLVFLYQHADFIERHLDALFTRYEGHFASSDKTRWLLQVYQHQLLTGTVPVWPPQPRGYWHPRTQSLTFWLGVCTHLQQFYYAQPDALMQDFLTLAQTREADSPPSSPADAAPTQEERTP
ncbi:MAG: hypothetical protein C7B46_20570 [Sulfobacillus benefaciens]|uniref:Uncharacterized protein n=1 Tax=Sulfobacillus benefaciens TaxID=453960 RepID=A0A2T2WTV7_9FIRM|nr:MAG: hypothetical protein C7B46_20570 [Sulfobacillus benefaciens]